MSLSKDYSVETAIRVSRVPGPISIPRSNPDEVLEEVKSFGASAHGTFRSASCAHLRAQAFECERDARILLQTDGSILDANASAERLILEGALALDVKRALSFKVRNSDERLYGALMHAQATGRRRKRLVLRDGQNHWRAVEVSIVNGSEGGCWLLAFSSTHELELEAVEPIAAAFSLTPTEAEVLMHLIAGAVPKEIARRMRNSTNTVRTHLRALFQKLGTRGITGALRQSIQLIG